MLPYESPWMDDDLRLFRENVARDRDRFRVHLEPTLSQNESREFGGDIHVGSFEDSPLDSSSATGAARTKDGIA
mgnify:CR=1 FL=1